MADMTEGDEDEGLDPLELAALQSARQDEANAGDLPEFPGWAAYIWQGFFRLSDDRPRDFIPIPLPTGGITMQILSRRIPWQTIRAYADCLPVDRDGVELFHQLVDEMDIEWLAWDAEQRQARQGG